MTITKRFNAKTCPSLAGIFKPHRLPLAILLAMTGVQGVQAQDAPLEEIMVTGSRIRMTSGMETPTPVTTVTALELQAMAPGTLIEGMAQLPQFYGSTTTANSAGFFTSPGAGSLNLRGLATKRTLTLLNGRRVVSSTIYGGPDINLFPEGVLRNVESVTGGATAAYGTDAVSGVVNFILDTDFEGYRGSVQGGQTSQGDNDNWEVSLAGGFKIGADTHVLLAGEMYEQDPVFTLADRDWYHSYGRVKNSSATAGDSPANPRDFVYPDVISTVASYDGVIVFPAASGLPQMISDSSGNAVPFVYGAQRGDVSHSVTTGGSGTNNTLDRPNIQPESSRKNLFGYIEHDLNENLKVYAQGMAGEADLVSTNIGGALHAGGGGYTTTIYSGNPFLPASLQSLMTANNVASFDFRRIGHSSDLAGNAFTQQLTSIWSVTTGFDLEISSEGFFDGWQVNGYFQYGETDVEARQHGGLRSDRIFLAVDAVINPATGQPACRVTVVSGQYPNCVPVNLFGRGRASAAAIDYVTGFDPGLPVSITPYLPGYPPETYSYTSKPYKMRDINLEQTVYELTANGELFEGWGAGPISMALGAHWRNEGFDQKVQAAQGNPTADPFVLPIPNNNAALGIRGVPPAPAANSVEFQFSKVPFARGEFDVSELFTEMLVPLVADAPLLDQLNASAAVRWAKYGGSGEIWSYKGGLDATLTEEVRLRATYSRDVRAATLGERFDRTGGAATIRDYGENLANPPQYGITIVSGGNPTVEPEKADTVTAGVVYQPAWLEGLSTSVDWYKVDLEDSIESLTAQNIIDACYRQGDTDQCGRIERNAPGSRISIVNQVFQNLAKATIEGVDFEVAYATDLDVFGSGERLGLRFLGSYLKENSTTSSNGVFTDRAGETGFFSLPEWKYTLSGNYTRGAFGAFVQARYIDEGLLSATTNIVSSTTGKVVYDVADNSVDSAVYVDTRLSYGIETLGGDVEMYLNVNNLFDEDPPTVVGPFGGLDGSPGINANSALFDLLGRRYTLGMRFDF